jgi:hypothetical protein
MSLPWIRVNPINRYPSFDTHRFILDRILRALSLLVIVIWKLVKNRNGQCLTNELIDTVTPEQELVMGWMLAVSVPFQFNTAAFLTQSPTDRIEPKLPFTHSTDQMLAYKR